MEIDTSNLTDEQINKLGEFVHKMEEENKATKWWIMPKYSVLDNIADFERYCKELKKIIDLDSTHLIKDLKEDRVRQLLKSRVKRIHIL